ncbi:MAG: uroporphyrinogen-III C-methyltransferase [Sulfuricaulis sp.]|uniref:uroporphyrinogen-III C-methyltransferase n=1 Tax=Sulfuricaulis sp. TaxID=2003553 RepID=UPI0025FD4556|nr:uroporphyrinogen-III C-methyltransferase [Sulfuricaulis sp.]MCR4346933.1 uroporphyrinogen-III C-methyltransferase [Sulfuricaulis sp.]
MTDTDAKNPPAEQAAASRRAKTAPKKSEGERRHGRVRGGLAVILATLALIASGYLWYVMFYESADLFSRDIVGALDRIESDSNQALETVANTEKDIKALKETQDAIRASLEKINSDLRRNRLEWALTETEQLMIIANNRLQLARDSSSALAALRAADQQLQQLAMPKFLPVRRELAREISLLESNEKLDIGGITLRLATQADNVDRLPLALDIRLREIEEAKLPVKAGDAQVASADGNWRQTARSLWQDILSLVRIRDDVASQRPLLPPEQQYFLRENLRLMLYGAQQALLQGSVPTFQQNLKTAQRLLKDYFDVESQIVTSMQTELTRLQTMKILTDMPNITASLTTLRRLSGRGEEP